MLEKQLKKNLSELPSHFIVDGEIVVVKNQPIKPFHDVTLLNQLIEISPLSVSSTGSDLSTSSDNSDIGGYIVYTL